MNQVEALLSALGACKIIVARSFAEANHIQLEDIKIELTGELDPDGFTGKNPDAKVGFSKITSKFIIKADNTEEEIAQFVHFIETHCPVNDTILNAPTLATEIETL